MPLLHHRRSAWAVLAALLLVGRIQSAAPRDELLRFVPDDAGVCLVVQNLRAHSTELLASPFARAWSKSALAAALDRSPEVKQLLQVEQYLRKGLGVDAATLRDDLLGDAFVFAYRPGPAGKPDQDQGLFLVRARNAAALSAFLDKLNALQKKTGELKDLVDCEHRGVKYIRRVGTGGDSYYLLRGPVLVYSGQENILQAALERDRTLADDAVPAWTRRLQELGLSKALAALALNPRVFDEALAARTVKEAGTRTFLACWKALQGVGLGLHLGRDLRVRLTVKADVDRLPPSARRLLGAEGQGSPAPVFPEDALFAATGRVDVPALYQLLGEFMPGKDRESLAAALEQGFGAVLGKSVLKDVLPALGPEWGVYAGAPPAGGKAWAPRLLFALRVAEGEPGDPADQALLSGVQLGAQLMVLGHNKSRPAEPIVLRTLVQDRIKVRYLDGDKFFPAGVQPAFALKSGFLVLASSPAEVRRFKVGPLAGPLVRISVKTLRAYLKDHRDALVAALAQRDRLNKEQAAAKVDGLRGSLELIDRIELTRKTSPGQAAWTLTVQPVEPLKKTE